MGAHSFVPQLGLNTVCNKIVKRGGAVGQEEREVREGSKWGCSSRKEQISVFLSAEVHTRVIYNQRSAGDTSRLTHAGYLSAKSGLGCAFQLRLN